MCLMHLSCSLVNQSCIMTWIGLFWKCCAQSTFTDDTVVLVVYAAVPGLIYSACQLRLANIFMLLNFKKHQHLEDCLHF